MISLIDRVDMLLLDRGFTVDFARMPRPLVEFEDQADGEGPYISHWDKTLGAFPTQDLGFSAYELHRSDTLQTSE